MQMKYAYFLNYLNEYQILKKNPAPYIWSEGYQSQGPVRRGYYSLYRGD